MNDTEDPPGVDGESDEELDRAHDIVMKRLILPKRSFFAALDDAVSQTPPHVSQPAEVLRANLDSAIAVVTVPYLMVSTGAVQSRFERLLIAEQIEAGAYSKTLSAAEHEKVQAAASKRLEAELQTDDSQRYLARTVVWRLGKHLKDQAFDVAAMPCI